MEKQEVSLLKHLMTTHSALFEEPQKFVAFYPQREGANGEEERLPWSRAWVEPSANFRSPPLIPRGHNLTAATKITDEHDANSPDVELLKLWTDCSATIPVIRGRQVQCHWAA